MQDLLFPNPVEHENDLYGRDFEVNQIEEILISNQKLPVIIIGERRIGKTSLLNVVLERLQSKYHPPFLPLHIQPRGLANFQTFVGAILQGLERSVQIYAGVKQAVALSPAHPFETIAEFETAFSQHLSGKEPVTIVLCIDEFNEIVRSFSITELEKLIGLLNHLIERSDLRLRLLFTMTRIPERLRTEIPSTLISTLISKSSSYELKPLDQGASAQLIQEITAGLLEWSAESLQEIFRFSGGHPYFTKLLLSRVTGPTRKLNLAGKITPEMVSLVVQEAANDTGAGHLLENIYRIHMSPFQQGLLISLSRLGNQISYQALRAMGQAWSKSARELSARHYFRTSDLGYEFNIRFWREWLLNWPDYEEECERFSSIYQALLEPINLEIDDVNDEVRLDGKPVRVTTQEKRILRSLAKQADQVVPREVLVSTVWNTLEGVSEEAVDTAIHRLRAKIGNNLVTVSRHGFVLKRCMWIPANKRKLD